jgi:uncharacterized protein with NRDE domain
MCLILFSFDKQSHTPLVVAANRDEFLQRPSANAHYWDDAPNVYAGRDLSAHGTWLGVTKTGRFTAVTNVREPSVIVENPLSRGNLTRGFLTSELSAEEYLQSLDAEKMRYSGFNLLVGEFSRERRELFYFSNRDNGIQALDSGVYGLSNALLDSAWPKVEAGKTYLRSQINNELDTQNPTTLQPTTLHHSLRAYLEDPSFAADEALPSTGVSYEREKALSAAFITLPDYGTRTSTVITIAEEQGEGAQEKQTLLFSEKQYFGDDADALTLERLDLL